MSQCFRHALAQTVYFLSAQRPRRFCLFKLLEQITIGSQVACR
nr:hypothetical protein [Zymobacter palmae]